MTVLSQRRPSLPPPAFWENSSDVVISVGLFLPELQSIVSDRQKLSFHPSGCSQATLSQHSYSQIHPQLEQLFSTPTSLFSPLPPLSTSLPPLLHLWVWGYKETEPMDCFQFPPLSRSSLPSCLEMFLDLCYAHESRDTTHHAEVQPKLFVKPCPWSQGLPALQEGTSS